MAAKVDSTEIMEQVEVGVEGGPRVMGQALLGETNPEVAAVSVAENHRLTDRTQSGNSEVEQLAHNFETRRANRIPVTKWVRRRFLRECRNIANERGYPKNLIHLSDLRTLRDQVQQEVLDQSNGGWLQLLKMCHIPNNLDTLVKVLDRAVEVVQSYQYSTNQEDERFYFQDFNFYHTVVKSRWPWMRPGIYRSFFIVLAYYLFAPIWFCHIYRDDDICVPTPGDPSGWISTLYFASTTLSTVGYGDLTVTKTTGKIIVGTLFMLLSNITLIMAFSNAISQFVQPFAKYQHMLINYVMGPPNDKEFLWKKVRRLRVALFTQLVLQFILLNAIGVFATRVAISQTDNPEQQWDWVTSIYWAIQTTTTIGYGDLDMAVDLRWFQVFYLVLSTYFVGNAVSGFASLRGEIEQIRRRTAWQRRHVTKGMIDEMNSYDHDDKIDQFEWAIASLLSLGKVTTDDLSPIMDKYRELCNENGFIKISSQREMNSDEEDNVGGGSNNANETGTALTHAEELEDKEDEYLSNFRDAVAVNFTL